MKRITLVTAIATLALTSACSTEVSFGTGSGGSGGQGGDGAGTTGAGGNVESCTDFENQESRETMTIRVVNNTDEPLYLRAECGSLEVDVFALVSNDNNRYTRQGDPCYSTCEDLQDGSPIVCGACQETVRLLDPGESYVTEWDGQGYRQREMPARCWWDDSRRGECSQRVNAPLQQSYEFHVFAGAECIGFGGPNGDACECNEDGVCYGSAEGDTFTANGIATLGLEGTVELSFF